MIKPSLSKIDYRQYQRYYQRIEPVLKSTEAKAYTMVILSFFTMSFFGIFAIRPTLTTITQLRKKIEDSRMLDAKLEEKINMVVKAQKEYEIIRGAIPAIYATIPDSPDFISILRGIEELASETGASISALQLKPIVLSERKIEDKKKEVENFELALSLSGNYSGVEKFLKDLSSLRRIVTIKVLNIDVSKAQNIEEINLSLKANAYYYK